MPDEGYRVLFNHLTELRKLYARLEPEHTGRERIAGRIEEAKSALRAHVRARVAQRSPRQ